MIRTELDQAVGRVAGAIYGDIAARFPHPPLMLVQPLTFKVRKVLEPLTDLALLSHDQKKTLADEIEVAIIPILFSYEIDPETIREIAPLIQLAALQALAGN